MKYLLLVSALACRASAGEYSKDDREALVAQLEESKRQLVIALEGMTHAQSVWKPDSATWSVVQVVEHLALAEPFLFGIAQNTLEKGKPIPDSEKLADPGPMDRAILERLPDRSQKAKAPEEATPKDLYQNRDDAFAAFGERREKTIEFVRTTKQDLRRYKIQSPMGDLDVHQWLLMISGHTQRHIKQIGELTSHELFPKP